MGDTGKRLTRERRDDLRIFVLHAETDGVERDGPPYFNVGTATLLALLDAADALDAAEKREAALLAACRAAYSLIGVQWAGPSLEVSNALAAAIAASEGRP